MAQEVAGKVIIVTGGAAGIGRAMVELFLEEGAKVVAGDIDEAGGKELLKLGGNVRFKRTDVANEDDIQGLVDVALKEFGALDVMVNNAAISSTIAASYLDLDLKDFKRVMDINVLGTLYGCQRAARHMAKKGSGSIINVASIAGTLAGHGPMTYRASKAAVVQLSKSIAIDLGRHKIRVNCLVPGNIVTKILMKGVQDGKYGTDLPMGHAEKMERAYRGTMIGMQPLKRQGQPRDVAQAALFLASDRSIHVTGTILPVDGGITAGDPVNHAERILTGWEPPPESVV